MSDAALRKSLIRLAHVKPQYRDSILPLLTQKTADYTHNLKLGVAVTLASVSARDDSLFLTGKLLMSSSDDKRQIIFATKVDATYLTIQSFDTVYRPNVDLLYPWRSALQEALGKESMSDSIMDLEPRSAKAAFHYAEMVKIHVTDVFPLETTVQVDGAMSIGDSELIKFRAMVDPLVLNVQSFELLRGATPSDKFLILPWKTAFQEFVVHGSFPMLDTAIEQFKFASSNFPPASIGETVSGPTGIPGSDAQKPWAKDHFTQDYFEELDEKQEAGELSDGKADKTASGDVPKKVEQLADSIREGNPAYTDAQAYATAWSVYCKYVEPNSTHCSMPPNEYLVNRTASDKGIRKSLIRLAHGNNAYRSLLPLFVQASEAELKKDADPVSHDQNKPETWNNLPPKGKQAAVLTDAQFEKEYGVRPGAKFRDEHGVWIVDYDDTKIPGMVTIYLSGRGKGHSKAVSVSELNSRYKKLASQTTPSDYQSDADPDSHDQNKAETWNNLKASESTEAELKKDADPVSHDQNKPETWNNLQASERRLRKAAIRLAQSNPEARKHLLPILASSEEDEDEGDREEKFSNPASMAPNRYRGNDPRTPAKGFNVYLEDAGTVLAGIDKTVATKAVKDLNAAKSRTEQASILTKIRKQLAD